MAAVNVYGRVRIKGRGGGKEHGQVWMRGDAPNHMKVIKNLGHSELTHSYSNECTR